MTKKLTDFLPVLLAATVLVACLSIVLFHPSPAIADESSEVQESQEQVGDSPMEFLDIDVELGNTENPESWDDPPADGEEGEPAIPEMLNPGWSKNADGTWYYGLNDGTAKMGWLKLGGGWYYLDPDNGGAMVTGLKTIKQIPYHFGASGKMSVGWAKESGSWYYAASSGALKTGWVKLSGLWYWLNPDNGGAMDTGLFEANGEWFTAGNDGAVRIDKWSYVDGVWYRADARGETMTGWFEPGAKKYWLEPELHGAMAIGFFAVDGVSYFADDSGSVVASRWIESNGNLFLAGADGALVQEGFRIETGGIVLKDDAGNILTGWQIAGDCKLYANPEAGGELVYGWIETAEGKYWANDQGIAQTGWVKVDGIWYHFDADGAMQTGWLEDADKRYYLEESGTMAIGWREIDGSSYYFKTSGAMQTGWLKDGGSWYYLADDGKMVTGWQKVEGTWYYLADDGKMATGWLKLGDDWYYLKTSGAMVTGLCVIDGQTYKFASSGKWIDPKVEMTEKAQSFSSNTSWLILVDTTQNKVSIFKGSKGNWEIEKYWNCSAGAPSTPTVKGTFTVGNRGTHFGEEKGYTCWYWTQFCGDYLFHSVLYEPYSKTDIQDGRLGQNLSHGCIRLHIDNAKWIYDNIPRGTKVYVY